MDADTINQVSQVEGRVAEVMQAFSNELSKVKGMLSQDTGGSVNPVLSTSLHTCLEALESGFTLFRESIAKELAMLTSNITRLEERQDSQEQYSRRSCLLLMGVTEAGGTDEDQTERAALDVFKNKLKLDICAEDIERSHRLGPVKAHKIRPIIVKFKSYKTRALVYAAKSQLKRSTLYIAESLTRRRLAVLNAARDRFGNEKCWTSDGKILINLNSSDGTSKRHVVTTMKMLDKIQDPTPAQTNPSSTSQLNPAPPGIQTRDPYTLRRKPRK